MEEIEKLSKYCENTSILSLLHENYYLSLFENVQETKSLTVHNQVWW